MGILKDTLKDYSGVIKSKRNLNKITTKAGYQYAKEINDASGSPIGIGIKQYTKNASDIKNAFKEGKPILARTIKSQRIQEAKEWAKSKK